MDATSGRRTKLPVSFPDSSTGCHSDGENRAAIGTLMSPSSTRQSIDSFSFQKITFQNESEPMDEFVFASSETGLTYNEVGFAKRSISIDSDGSLLISEDNEDQLSVGSTSTESIRANVLEEYEHTYIDSRERVVNKNGFISTPLHIVKMLAIEAKKKLHIEHYLMRHPRSSKKLCRVDILVGPFRGVGQCTDQRLARQLAALDIIDKLKSNDEGLFGGKVPRLDPCALLPGWRVDKLVHTVFKDVCFGKNLPFPKFTTILKEHELAKVIVQCHVGEMVTEGESELPWLAKKLAAKAMIEKITNEAFPIEKTTYGSHVLGFPEMKLLGFKPEMSAIKRKWMITERVQDTQVVVPTNEPDDGDMDDLEEEVQILQSKKCKMPELKETLLITATDIPAAPSTASTSTKNRTRKTRTRRVVSCSVAQIPTIKEEEAVDDADMDPPLIIDIGEDDTLP